MYTLIAVFVHFNHFTDLKINFHTNPYNLASSTAVVILGALWYNLRYLQLNHHLLWETNWLISFLYFVLYSLPLCPTFAPSGQPNNNPSNTKTICLNKCFDPHCERRNSSHWCDGIVGCYWCQKDENGRKLEKPYCASSERCFRGKESATYERKSTLFFLFHLSFQSTTIKIIITKHTCTNGQHT